MFEEGDFTNNLFVYGTLMHGQCRNYVLNGLLFEKALLQDYEKQDPPSLGFPIILQKEGSFVEGELYYDITDSLLKRIDLIEGEGDLYNRIVVKVITTGGQVKNAFVYYPSNILVDTVI